MITEHQPDSHPFARRACPVVVIYGVQPSGRWVLLSHTDSKNEGPAKSIREGPLAVASTTQ
jgi:hypothetical protein